MAIKAFASIPTSWSQAKKTTAADGGFRITRFDVDNTAKLILDAMEGVVYQNDKQVVRLIVDKGFANEPRVVVRVEPYNGD